MLGILRSEMKEVELFMLIEIDYILACAQNKQLYPACNDQQLQLKLRSLLMHTFADHKITSTCKICGKLWFKLKFREKMFFET